MDDALDTLLAKLAAAPTRRPPFHLVGTRRFELRRKLGAGGFGEVYEARDREHGTLVALKALKASHPDWIYRFKREFRIVGDLAHPNLIRLYELFVEDDRWYLTMELIDGRPLDEHLRRAPDQLRSCFGQLALGILELHRAHCLHRDLKASNALVEPTGRVVLLDFGLAVDQRASRTSALAGTPLYMAPEVGLGQPPATASDWYAFGVMLYTALAGQAPFSGDERAILAQKLGPAPPRPSTLRPDVDPLLEDLAMRLLCREPRERPRADEILRGLVGEASAAPPRGPRAPLAGRGRELAELHAALDASTRGLVVVTVRGEAGLGKTSLMSHFLDAIRDRAQVYSGRCLELESVPFKGLDGAIDMLCNDLRHRHYDEAAQLVPDDVAALAQMFPMMKRIEAFTRHLRGEQRARSPQEVRQAASAALRQLVAALAERAPVVLFDDDLQWTSDDSVRLLLDLVRAPAPAMLLVVAYREDAAGPAPAVERFLAGLAELGVTRCDVRVEPLDEAGVAELVASHADASLAPDQAMRETGGHPYLLTRLLERGGRYDGPIDLAAVLATELAQLDDDARALLEIVAIAGAPISRGAAFAALGASFSPATLDLLRRRRLLLGSTASEEPYLEAYHERVRAIALADVPADRKRELHGKVAAALEATGLAEPGTLAHHYRLAGDRVQALAWIRRAAEDAAEALAFARAAAFLAEATALADDDAERLELLDELGRAQVQAGHRRDAGATNLTAAALAASLGREARAAELRARAGEDFLLAGDLARGLDMMRDALAGVGVSMPTSAAVAVAESFNLGGALATRGLGYRARPSDAIAPELLQRVDLELAVSRALLLVDLRAPMVATHAAIHALDAGDEVRVQRALALLAVTNSARSPEDAMVVEAEARAGELAKLHGDTLGAAWAELARGMRAIQLYEFTTAIDALARAEQLFLAGSLSHAREATFARIAILIVCGNYCVDLAYARDHLGRVEDDARARGDMFGVAWAALTRCSVGLGVGDLAMARASLAAARAPWPEAPDSLFTAMCMLNDLFIAQYEAPAVSVETVARIEPEFRRMFTSLIPLPRAVFCRSAASSTIAAWEAGTIDTHAAAQRVSALAEELASTRHHRSDALLLDSYRCALAGDRRGRIARLEQAADGWDASNQRPLARSARLRSSQYAGDASRERAIADELRALAIAEPDRFAMMWAGPGPLRK